MNIFQFRKQMQEIKEMKKQPKVEDIDVTELRFRLVIAMLAIDEHLAKRLKAYLAWYC